MEINYEKLDYQSDAVNSVVNTLSGYDNTINTLIIDKNTLDKSVQETLSKNNQKYPGESYLDPFPQFNIEMETGTGKTMVYLQTIMEIHKRFNENKFIIVVPSRAIKAGVEDSLEKLKDYLSTICNTDKYNYFVYDSKELSRLQNFQGNSFEIMITTVQAFNKNSNIINQDYSEGFFGGKPIDQIRDSNPIVIIDEPQSVDSAPAGKRAIKSLNPKVVLRYSATHKDKQYPLLYEFGPVKAYRSGMVKRIEVLGTEINTDGNIPVFGLKEPPKSKKGKLQAKIIAYKLVNNNYEKRVINMNNGEYLSEKTKNPRYKDLGMVTEINALDNFVKFQNGDKAELGDLDGEHDIWVKTQLSSLIKDHLDKELKIQSQGIKVLSLIFVDSVDNYRIYTNNGFKNGKYAKLFEDLYDEIIHSDSKYKNLNDYNVPVNEVHDGYFAMDKATKNKPVMYRDTKGNGDSAKDESAYEAIMMDKENLLTQYSNSKIGTHNKASKLRFIFSHSALKEGWDNPNVFQILTMTSPKNDLTRRQKIGRGLRIPVNQDGQRVYDDKQNFVTIYANETFEDFALGLQHEYIESGTLDNEVTDDFFANLIVKNDKYYHYHDGSDYELFNNVIDNQVSSGNKKISDKESKTFVSVLRKNGFINDNNKINYSSLNKLNSVSNVNKIINDSVESGINKYTASSLIDNFTDHFDTPNTYNRRKREVVEITDKDNPYFKSLWNKLSKMVNYHVEFSEDKLIDDIVNGSSPLSDIKISKMTTVQTRARLNLDDSQISSNIISQNTEHLNWSKLPIVDISRQIADICGLTRQFVIKIILMSNKKNPGFINKIKMNPSLFIQRAIDNIVIHQRKLLSKSLVYVQNGSSWSPDKLQPFDSFDNNLWEIPDNALSKTLFKKIKVQSKEEENFAKSLSSEEKVKYFLKLPDWFKIPTPFGNYVPDWAIILELNGKERMYFVVDTKTTVEQGELSPKEQDRIESGRRAYMADGFDDVKFDAPVKVIGDLDF